MKILPEQIEIIREKTLSGDTAKEIAKFLGITVGMVEYQRKKNKWNSRYDPNILNVHFEEIKKLIQNNVTDSDIAKKFNCNKVTVFNFRKKNHIERKNLRIAHNIKLSEKDLTFLIGTILGDSSLILRGKSPYYTCAHSIKQAEYAKFKAYKLKKFSSKYIKNSNRNSVTVSTLGNQAFYALYKNFYINKVKVIPWNLLKYFTAESLAYLFMDDGYAIYGKNHNISTVGIALCAFTSEELIKFTEFLYQKFNLKFKIHKHHSKRYNKDYLNLYLCAESFNLFQKLVSPYLMDWARYKIGRLVTL